MIICIVEMSMCAFLLCHLDTMSLLTWVKEFIASVISGRLNEYVDIVSFTGAPINYSIIPIAIMSIFMIPFYFLEGFFGFTGVFYFGWKLLMLGFSLVALYLFSIILRKLEFSWNKRVLGLVVFSVFPAEAIEVVARGQIDFVAIVFILLGLLLFLDKRYHLMSLMFGISIIVKPFGILIFGTIMCLILFQKRWKVIIYIAEFFALYCIDKVLMNAFYPNYMYYVDAYYTDKYAFDFVGRIFEVSLLGIPIYIVFSLIMMIICIYMSYKKTRTIKSDFLMMASMCTIFIIMVRWNNNWIAYFVPVIIIAALFWLNDFELIISVFVLGLVYDGYICVSGSLGTYAKIANIVNDMYFEHEDINSFLSAKVDNVDFYRNVALVFVGLGFVYIIIRMIYNYVKNKEKDYKKEGEIKIYQICLVFAPSLLYLLSAYLVLLL